MADKGPAGFGDHLAAAGNVELGEMLQQSGHAGSPYRRGPAVGYTDRGVGEPEMNVRYFEELEIGQKFTSPVLSVDVAAITAFAARFDPQPFHLDDAAARNTMFEGLAASGWHTAALSMRLCLASDFRPAGGIVGIGGELAWPRPVRPGDELRVEIEVTETRESRSRPGQGIVKVKVTTRNQHGETVQTFTPTLFVDRRPARP
jgi:acyl dehydratase